MKWAKLGRIFCPSGTSQWMAGYAAMPIAQHIEGDIFKMYFSARDGRNRSFVGFLVVDLNDPQTLLEISQYPLLSPGPLGSFDDSGAMASCLLSVGSDLFLYYVGWNNAVTVPFRNSIGLAISRNGGKTFQKYSEGPLLDRSTADPYFVASNCVLLDKDIFKMWYLSCIRWSLSDGKPKHFYTIKYAESSDGVVWNRTGCIAIHFKDEAEYAISAPRVLIENGRYKMWYSWRGTAYRIGYAESDDGVNWIRMDQEAGIDVSRVGWDSEMICYPFIFDHKGRRYLLYNGNNYGKTGFGLAVLD